MKNYSVSENIERLICYATTHLHLSVDDVIYSRNKLLYILKAGSPAKDFKPDIEEIKRMKSPTAIVNPLLDYSVKNELIGEEQKLQFETEIIDVVCPRPSQIIEYFDRDTRTSIKSACDSLYNFCFKSNYIRYDDVTSNVKWIAPCEKTNLEITINTSKPEKDNKAIAAEQKAAPVADKYPSCVLCKENVGFTGKPYRHTLRTIPMFLNNEAWHMQYSPYNYYPEHCIVLADHHVPMHVTDLTIKRLFDFIESFPHYFLGSNASLPIIGGSILSHDHYQGGAHTMPVHNTKTKYRLYSAEYPGVRITMPDWYNSTIRFESRDRAALESIISVLRDKWDNYNNKALNIISKTDEQHSAITPIARFNEQGEYCLDVILRNNRADEKHPDGIFHVSPDLFNIKKEGIGLIEAMGVFILPGRLAHEASLIKDYLTGAKKLDLKELSNEENPLNKHAGFIVQLINDNGTALTEEAAGEKIEHAINKACERILKCTAVFKEDDKGTKAFLEFMKSMGFNLSE